MVNIAAIVPNVVVGLGSNLGIMYLWFSTLLSSTPANTSDGWNSLPDEVNSNLTSLVAELFMFFFPSFCSHNTSLMRSTGQRGPGRHSHESLGL